MSEKWRIESAPIDKLAGLQDELNTLLIAIGGFMDPDDPGGWADNCWVTDMSTLGDFGPDMRDLRELGDKLGFAVIPTLHLYTICQKMRVRSKL